MDGVVISNFFLPLNVNTYNIRVFFLIFITMV